MAIPWTKDERNDVEQGIAKHPIESGRCAALARVIYKIAKPGDPDTYGVQLRPQRGARYLVPIEPNVPYWHSHTLVATHDHNVDAVTGADGYHAKEYLERYWHFHQMLTVEMVDVETIDVGIEDDVS
ncbi:MAG: hypothetical protein IPM54_12645 [Polyangiaceae bacterium]|nr:hypothetical protein [Polyangiaceae bacterium]